MASGDTKKMKKINVTEVNGDADIPELTAEELAQRAEATRAKMAKEPAKSPSDEMKAWLEGLTTPTEIEVTTIEVPAGVDPVDIVNAIIRGDEDKPIGLDVSDREWANMTAEAKAREARKNREHEASALDIIVHLTTQNTLVKFEEVAKTFALLTGDEKLIKIAKADDLDPEALAARLIEIICERVPFFRSIH